jgi:hypothetical protein
MNVKVLATPNWSIHSTNVFFIILCMNTYQLTNMNSAQNVHKIAISCISLSVADSLPHRLPSKVYQHIFCQASHMMALRLSSSGQCLLWLLLSHKALAWRLEQLSNLRYISHKITKPVLTVLAAEFLLHHVQSSTGVHITSHPMILMALSWW